MPFSSPHRLALLCPALALLAPAAFALAWENPERDLKIQAGVAEVVVEFPFKNESAAPVSILEVKSGCECSVAALPDKPVPPGGSGVLKVAYHPGDRPGPRTIPLEVRTDEPGAAPVVLRIKAELEPVLAITPVLLRWTRGAAADARSVSIRVAGKTAVASLSLATPPPSVAATLSPGAQPGAWTLSVAPASTRDEATVRLDLKARVDGRDLEYHVYVLVR